MDTFKGIRQRGFYFNGWHVAIGFMEERLAGGLSVEGRKQLEDAMYYLLGSYVYDTDVRNDVKGV